MVFLVMEGEGRLERRRSQSSDQQVACVPALSLTHIQAWATAVLLTSGCQQQGAVLPIQVLHGGHPGVPRVAIVEIVQLLSFLPVPKT